MSNDAKVIVGIGLLSVAILVGIVVFGSNSTPSFTEPKQVSDPELIRSESRTVGPEDAKVTLVEFADFQCPACASVHPGVKQLKDEYSDRVRFVHRHFPLSSIHPNAELAARASESAAQQGKFWEMYNKLFEDQNRWSSQLNPEGTFVQYARDLGLDTGKFKDALKDNKITEIIAQDKGDGNALQVDATPTFFLNGQKYAGDTSYSGLKSAIDAVLAN